MHQGGGEPNLTTRTPTAIPIPAAAKPRPHLLLLGLVAARPAPANVAALARLFRISRPTARAWRDHLLRAGLLAIVDGWLQLVPDRFAAWKAEQAQALAAAGRSWRAGLLPVGLLAIGRGHHVHRLPPAQLLAAAHLVAEADRDRQHVVADHELARRAGCSRGTLRTARDALVAAGVLLVRRVRRGMGAMILARLSRECWRTALAGLAALAQLAERHRRGAQRRGKPLNAPPCPQGIFQKAEQKQSLGRRGASSQEPTRDRLVAINALLAGMAKHCSAVAAPKPPTNDPMRHLRTMLAEPGLRRLHGMNPATAAEQVLLAAGAMSRSPRRRRDAAGLLAARLGRSAGTVLAAVVADVVLDRPRDPGAVLAWRVGELAAGRNPVRRRGVPLGQLIAAARQQVSA